MKTGQLPSTGRSGTKEERLQARLDALLERKPNLKLEPNHRKQLKLIHRVWNKGTAYSDGKGWYHR